MTDDVYHLRIMELARAATGSGRLDGPDGEATADNPLCGDRVTVEVRLKGGRIAEMAHRVRGCLLCRAAATLAATGAPGKTAGEITAAAAALAGMLEGSAPAPAGEWSGFEVFMPVVALKSRHHCVLLPFQALGKALEVADGDGF